MDQFYPSSHDILNSQTVGQELEELAGLHQELLGNRGLLNTISGDQGIPGQNYPVNIETKNPWLDEPPGAQPFDPQESISLPAAAGDTVVLTMLVPAGYDGVINEMSCNFTGGGFTQGSGDIIWSLRVDGKPYPNFGIITNEKGTPLQGRKIGRIRVYSGQRVQWLVNHVANLALNGNVICSLTGYFYPSRGN